MATLTSAYSQQRKFVVFDRRRFVIAKSRPIPVRALAKIYPETVSSDSSNCGAGAAVSMGTRRQAVLTVTMMGSPDS